MHAGSRFQCRATLRALTPELRPAGELRSMLRWRSATCWPRRCGPRPVRRAEGHRWPGVRYAAAGMGVGWRVADGVFDALGEAVDETGAGLDDLELSLASATSHLSAWRFKRDG